MSAAWSSAGGYDRALRRAAWAVWAFCLILSAAGLALLLVNLPDLGPIAFPGSYAALAIAVGYATVGLLIVAHRPGHGMGWLFLLLASLAAVSLITQQYALASVLRSGSELLPATAIAAWMTLWLQIVYFPTGLSLPYLLFPDGHLPSRRWRPVAWLAVVLMVVGTFTQMTDPGPIYFFLSNVPMRLPVNNPVGVDLGRLRDILGYSWLLSIFVLMAAMFAPIARFRRARRTERQQLKWFVYFAILTLLMFPLAFAAGETVGNFVIAMTILILPVGTAVAILRYHLYDIDVIIRRTVTYAVLTAVLSAVYFGSIILLQTVFRTISGQESPLVIVLSTLLIAALFTPLRGRVQGVIDRRFFRQKYDAERVLERFSQTARDEVELEALTAELLAVVDETMQPESVSMWIRME